MASRSSHPALSHADGVANSWADFLQLVGRVLIAILFLTAGWGKFGNPAGTLAYFTNLKIPSPQIWVSVIPAVEIVIGIALVLGLATRYAAAICFLFVLVATAIAHRYWEYPAAQQTAQYVNFTKNLAIMGGVLYVFVFGAGAFSLDAKLAKKRR
ncbi:MAG: DoxX family protein [Rhizobiales bacterium]|nr:DoxX family protein [Hyphomicrobiales bacterium]